MPVIGVESSPIQFDVPAPSVTVPVIESPTLVPTAVAVRMIGKPAKTKQKWPIATPPQIVLADPAPNAEMVYRIDGCAANWMNGLFAAKPAPATIGLLFASSTPSAETRQPAAPNNNPIVA